MPLFEITKLINGPPVGLNTHTTDFPGGPGGPSGPCGDGEIDDE